uniref:Lipid scramblase CLPTM1L n=1 Tax=Sus scrofa TaxID=9823 RepID=A0A8D1TJ34_PIG
MAGAVLSTSRARAGGEPACLGSGLRSRTVGGAQPHRVLLTRSGPREPRGETGLAEPQTPGRPRGFAEPVGRGSSKARREERHCQVEQAAASWLACSAAPSYLEPLFGRTAVKRLAEAAGVTGDPVDKPGWLTTSQGQCAGAPSHSPQGGLLSVSLLGGSPHLPAVPRVTRKQQLTGRRSPEARRVWVTGRRTAVRASWKRRPLVLRGKLGAQGRETRPRVRAEQLWPRGLWRCRAGRRLRHLRVWRGTGWAAAGARPSRPPSHQVINRSTAELPLTVSYDKISLGRLRFWIHMQDAVYSLQQLGFSEKDADEVKGIFVDTNLYFLALTFFVAAFHLLFDFLAFKNDISFWKKKKTMIGMSTKAVLWRCFSTVVIFLFLLDEQTSLLVLVPAGIGAAIELWKVKKALKMSVVWRGLRPAFQFGSSSESERKTEEYDTQAMTLLSYLLYPLCVGGAVYSLLNVKYKSWYSWLINSFVNGVYAFGFLFMLPQLFVNYKMKSVAHLPWKAFTYKAFNTFIDDVFAFIITMPTSHRLACFRDDVVFLVYLYQRWLYPVDKSRVNEFGESYEESPPRKPHTD